MPYCQRWLSYSGVSSRWSASCSEPVADICLRIPSQPMGQPKSQLIRQQMGQRISQPTMNDWLFLSQKVESSIKLYLYIYLLSFIYGGLKSLAYRRCESLVRRFLAEVRSFLGISWEVFSIKKLKLGGF